MAMAEEIRKILNKSLGNRRLTRENNVLCQENLCKIEMMFWNVWVDVLNLIIELTLSVRKINI